MTIEGLHQPGGHEALADTLDGGTPHIQGSANVVVRAARIGFQYNPGMGQLAGAGRARGK
jgi:hypothetical protein